MKYFVISFTIFTLSFSPVFSLAQVSIPDTLEEAKGVGENIFVIAKRELPRILKGIWEREVLPIWLKMWSWTKGVFSPLIEKWFLPEYQKRKEYFEENFESEKDKVAEEVKEEVPKVTKSLWEKFKELIK